ncbi:hypothetical protein GXP67_02595 [Rhodocytophaga rosea]|uniref:DUF4177 domain-containing protein n=1 Tax=Rhodocytophaga rosea TaxID=2704465 RepID=A0A6C0GCE2_9BACT|nr:hypothetical protein [Rhodocytophaga rosea]QHT65631.1 hypothetical protein GXP67_02595 [Rhodocytophaga rosea]
MRPVLILAFLFLSIVQAFAQNPVAIVRYEYMQVTTIESLVGAGLGRSRMITTGQDGKIQEIPLENFFSVGGINFENIRNNDQAITNKINELSNQGWELTQTSTGAVADQGRSIFITRYLFRKPKQ